jgi:hypothetical protein
MDKDFIKGFGIGAVVLGLGSLLSKPKKRNNPISGDDSSHDKNILSKMDSLIEGAGEGLHDAHLTGEIKPVKKAIKKVLSEMDGVIYDTNFSRDNFKKEYDIFNNFLKETDEDKLLDDIEEEKMSENFSAFINKLDKKLGR